MQIISVIPVIAFWFGCSIGAVGAETQASQPGFVKTDNARQPKCSTEIQPFEGDDGRFRFRNDEEETLVPARFYVADCFLETGIAAVADEVGWAYIDLSGNVVLRPYVFDNGPDQFVDGLARFVKDRKMGFFDIRGRVTIGAQFEFVEPFANGRAKFCSGCAKNYAGEHWTVTGGVWGVIDRQGRPIGPPQ